MIYTVVISTRTVVKAATAAKISADHAEPQVRLKIAISAVGVSFHIYMASHQALIEVLCVSARLQFKLPFRDRALVVR